MWKRIANIFLVFTSTLHIQMIRLHEFNMCTKNYHERHFMIIFLLEGIYKDHKGSFGLSSW